MSSLYESNNNNSEQNSNEFWYDKNEFYSENGLSKGQKKDRKSHGKKAQEQHEQREDKVSKQVLLLPKKMQKALKALDKDKDKVVSVKTKEVAANPQQVNQVKYIKTINRRGKKEDFALALDESAEEDAANEEVVVAANEEVVVAENSVEVDAYTYIKAKREFQMYPENWTEDELQQFKETIDRYEALNSYDQGVKMWQLHGLTEKDYIENMEKEMREKSRFENWCFDDEEEEVVNDYTEYHLSAHTYNNYIKAKREVQMYPENWSEEELQQFKETIDNYEALSTYEQGVKMWQSYGFTEAQYAANQEKELSANSLFEEWYYDEEHQDAIYAEEDDAAADYAEWLEAKEEERLEFAMQNCIDDMYSDSD